MKKNLTYRIGSYTERDSKINIWNELKPWASMIANEVILENMTPFAIIEARELSLRLKSDF